MNPIGWSGSRRPRGRFRTNPSTARAFPDQPEVALLADFLEWRDRVKSFSHVAVYSPWENNFGDSGGARRIQSARVSAQFLSVLGIRPLLGRDFRRDEEEPGQGQTVLLAYPFWQQQFGGEPSAVGRRIQLDGEPYEVVGVLPADFVFPFATSSETQLLRPMGIEVAREMQRNAMRFHYSIARLASAATIADAAAELDVFRARINEKAPQMKEWVLVTTLRPLHEQLVGNVQSALWILFAAVGCVLLIACLNVGNLLLARASTRRREMAIRGSLGAGRSRLARQMITESALLVAGGSLAGTIVALFVRSGLEAIRPAALFHAEMAPLNLPLFAFLLVASGLTVLVCGLLPALAASNTSPINALRSSASNASPDAARRRLLGSLVVGQLALALVLIVASSLLVQSFRNMRFKNLGFRTEGVITASLALDRVRYPNSEKQRLFFEELLDRARALPGADKAALTMGLPPGGGVFCSAVYAEGSDRPETPLESPCVPHQAVSAEYFSALEIPLQQGDLFTDSTPPDGGEVVVNASFARSYFGASNPIGRRFRPPRGEFKWRTVIGVVADCRNKGLTSEPEPHVYLPYRSEAGPAASLILVTSGSVRALTSAIGSLVADIDPAQAVARIETLDQGLTREISRERFLTWVLAAFGACALLLAAVGIHGVVQYAVRQRRHELGVRLALGASPRDLLRQVLGSSTRLLAAGVLTGLVASGFAVRLLSAFLFQTSPTDWRVFALAAAILSAAALCACYWPAKAASQSDPLTALRED